MAITTTKSAFLHGLRDGAPFLLVVGPFALLYGVVAAEAGLWLSEAMGFSVIVIAGAAQFAALQLMVNNAGIALILLAALAVNLRMAMYSAALVPYLGAAPLWKRALVSYVLFDQTYVASVARFEKEPDMTVHQRAAFFWGTAMAIVPVWMVMCVIGFQVGAAIPPELALDFALPITFLAMVGPMLRTIPHVVAAVTSVVVALLLIGLPSGLGLIIAACCAMAAGVATETLLERRAA